MPEAISEVPRRKIPPKDDKKAVFRNFLLTSGRLFATYKVDPKLSITGSLAHETYRSQDWRLDGVQPATVANLLAFGTQPSNYEITVLRVALRYRF